MAGAFWRLWRLTLIMAALVVAAQTGAQPPSTTSKEGGRFLVYFDEFSAFLSDEAKTIIADAAKRAREAGARRMPVGPGPGQCHREAGNEQVSCANAQFDRHRSAGGERHRPHNHPTGPDRSDRFDRSDRHRTSG